ncbi:MAG: hypothetical protein ACLTA5_07490 [Anaerococcus obesiensis]
MMASGKSYEVTGVGYTMKNRIETKELKSGDVGFIEASIKDIRNARVGDTITLKNNPTQKHFLATRSFANGLFWNLSS